MLIHIQLQLPAARAQAKTLYTVTYLTSWHNSIFGYKLRTDLRTIEAENR